MTEAMNQQSKDFRRVRAVFACAAMGRVSEILNHADKLSESDGRHYAHFLDLTRGLLLANLVEPEAKP